VLGEVWTRIDQPGRIAPHQPRIRPAERERAGVIGAYPHDLLARNLNERHAWQDDTRDGLPCFVPGLPMVVRAVVVGGGIIGIATARTISLAQPDAEVVLLEKEAAVAQHQTSHNSGVVHAGLYYEPGSLKARLCRRGVGLLRDFCAEREIAYEECGKVVVALDAGELDRLERLAERAAANGVPGLRRLDEADLHELEPAARGVAGLHSPTTAIVDFAAVARALADDLRERSGTVRLGQRVVSVRHDGPRASVALADGQTIAADRVIVCAGLQADRLAVASDEPPEPRIVPFRGEYWKLRRERAGLVRGLIYPVPDPSLPFLGVHLTKRIDGDVWIGPGAVLATAREGYGRGSFCRRDVLDALTWPGTLRMMRRHWRAGMHELTRTASKRAFIRDARRYVPSLRRGDCERAPAGVRAQAVDLDGTLVDDFRLGVSGPVAWVRNAPSPGATSSLAIAEELYARSFG
jgi:L-2-hydroxyglutarate oxidase LhgO